MTPPKSGMNVSCPCGASLEIDPNETTQEIACPECGMTLEIAVAIDSRTKQVKLGILVKSGSVSHRTAKGKGVEVHTAKCVCGALITVESGGVDAVYTCSACEADYTAVLKKPRSGGMSTLVLRPLVTSPATKRTPPKTAAPPPRPTKAPPAPPPPRAAVRPASGASAAGLAAKEKLLQMSKSDIGAQEYRDGKVACFCHASIGLPDGNPREIIKCPECGMGFRIFQATNPKTGDAMAVMIPRS